jgi:lycopene cyclase domain-containing protein
MTYFGFLALFLMLPIGLLFAWVVFNWQKMAERSLIEIKRLFVSFLVMICIALIYTTPWDNYLVATRVWWYEASRVFGITLGWVPLEEYLFFILQPILVGLWMLILLSRQPINSAQDENDPRIRRILTVLVSIVWMISILLLIYGGSSMQYLGLELVWALPAFILQLAFGADILWRRGRLLILTIVPLTIYLSLADAIAIQSGIWTISPSSSLNILLGGILPVEELVFFLLTNSLVALGFTLIWAPESRSRLRKGWEGLKRGNWMPLHSDDV